MATTANNTSNAGDGDDRIPRKPGAKEPPRDLARDVQQGVPSFPGTDHFGNRLRPGMKVLVPMTVMNVYSFGHVNLLLETEHPLRPGMATTTMGLSGHQVVSEEYARKVIADEAQDALAEVEAVEVEAVEEAPAPLPRAACRQVSLLEAAVASESPDPGVNREHLFAVYYAGGAARGEPFLAAFRDKDDTMDWVERQIVLDRMRAPGGAFEPGLTADDFEVVALRVVSPLVARAA